MSNFSFQRLQVYQLAKEALTLLIGNRENFRGLLGELLPQIEKAMVSENENENENENGKRTT